MKRQSMRQQASSNALWDMLVVGGGATGLGIAVDAASRGHRVLLVERGDFAQGTSSRSTKLIHGGVRYLQQGNLSLVTQALKERGTLQRNAPHLVRDLPILVPSYAWWESPFYGLGLKLYDWLAGDSGFGHTHTLGLDEVLQALPNIEQEGLRGGTLYHDGQFDDAALALSLAHTAAQHGAVLLNHCELTGLLQDEQGRLCGARVFDHIDGDALDVRSRVTINATGAYSDTLRALDGSNPTSQLAPSQGSHLVLPREFLAGDTAVLLPHTRDGRVLFLIPWLGCVLVGTTDVAVSQVPDEPVPQDEEINFLLSSANAYLTRDATRADVLSVFAGIRPLVAAPGAGTASLSREHVLQVDERTGLLSVIGGKWTTYRLMAQEAVDLAQARAHLPDMPCVTEHLLLAKHRHAHTVSSPPLLHPRLSITAADVRYACEHDMAMRVEDVLSRRHRCLLLDARAASEVAAQVAQLMAQALGRDGEWVKQETRLFQKLATQYLPQPKMASP
jgi:glycerol-3-phosphate dehydrogenase